MPKKRRSARGSCRLLGGAETLAAATRTRGQQKIRSNFSAPIHEPAANFGEDGLDELAASIRKRHHSAASRALWRGSTLTKLSLETLAGGAARRIA
jgi:hypothetical protein